MIMLFRFFRPRTIPLVLLLSVCCVVLGLAQTAPTISSISPTSAPTAYSEIDPITVNVMNVMPFISGSSGFGEIRYVLSNSRGDSLYGGKVSRPSSTFLFPLETPYSGPVKVFVSSLSNPINGVFQSLAPGDVFIRIIGQNGRSNSAIFTYTDMSIVSFSPSSGPPGTVVTLNVRDGVPINNSNGLGSFRVLQVNSRGDTTAIGYDGSLPLTSRVYNGPFQVTVPPIFYPIRGSSYPTPSGPLTITLSGGRYNSVNPIGSISGGTASVVFTVTAPTPPLPIITSFTPASGTVGTLVTLTGTGFRFAGGRQIQSVQFGSGAVVTGESIGAQTETQLVVLVPPGAQTGPITMTDNSGRRITTTTPFTVIPPVPTISGFSPTSGMTGALVSIIGTNFTGATSVRFGGLSANLFDVNTDGTLIAVTVPALASSGTISVTTPGGTATSANGFTISAPAPTITAFTPTGGIPGAVITISGTNFTGATAVRLGGINVPFTAISPTQITATVTDAGGSGVITVITPSGTATSGTSFTFMLPSPVISSFTPTSGGIGTSVVLSGSNFTTVSRVFFGSFSAQAFSIDSDTQITAIVPNFVTTATIILQSPRGTAISATPFTYVPGAPIISGITPTGAPAETLITIQGSGLTGATNVLFTSTTFPSGISVTPTVVSDRIIRVSVPISASSGPVTVTTPRGTVTSAFDFVVTLVVNARYFTPASGAVGTNVVVSGSQLAGATSVRFGDVEAPILSNTDSQIQTRVPAVVSGRVPIIVRTPSGVGTPPYALFSVSATPSLTGFAPASGAVLASVVLTGSNFTGATAVKFGSTPATAFTVNSGTQITATVPADAATGVISVVTPSGTAASGAPFTIITAPNIVRLSPGSGSVGTTLAIVGVGFTGVSSVSIGAALMTFTVNSDGQITATLPAGALAGIVSVTTPGGTARSASPFTILPPTPTISGFAPPSALAGAVITINGTNFTGATAVSFGTTPAASFTVVSATQITATVPGGVSAGAVSVVTPNGTATSSAVFALLMPPPIITNFTPTSGSPGASITITGQNFAGTNSVSFGAAPVAGFTVSADGRTITATVGTGSSGLVSVVTPNGLTSSSAAFTYLPPVPSITSIAPTSIRAGEASTLTIQGANLSDVRLGGTDDAGNTLAPSLLSNTATAVSFSIMPIGAGLVTFTLTTLGGSVNAPPVTVQSPRPFITGFSPTRARTGDMITISGTNLDAASAVTLGGTPASIVVGSNTSTRVQGTVGTGASGAVQVTTPGGTASAAASFSFDASARPPVITGFSPASGPAGTRVTISGTGFTRDGLNIGINYSAWHEIVSVTPTEIVFVVGANAQGQTGRIQIWSAAGYTESSGNFTCTIPTTLDAPIPTSPANAATLTSTTSYVAVSFLWNAAVAATTYSIQTSLDAGFSSAPNAYTALWSVSGTIANSYIYTPRSGQPPLTTYWRVRALNGAVQSPWSAVQRVLAAPPVRILSVSPAEMQQSASVTMTITGESTDFTIARGISLILGSTTIIGALQPGATPTQCTASFTIPPDAPLGFYSVVVSGAPSEVRLLNSLSITSASGELEVPVTTGFNTLVHGFNFCNCSDNIWPTSAWSSIDYTSSVYPTAVRTSGVSTSVFPSFDDYAAIKDLNTGAGTFYSPFYSDGSRYPGSSPSVVNASYISQWLGYGPWGGSCDGMSQVSLLNYAGVATYQFSGRPFSLGSALTNDNLRKLINRHQNWQTSGAFGGGGVSVNQTLAQLRADLASGDPMRHRRLWISPQDGCVGHAIIPTGITTSRNVAGQVIERIAVYDVNLPGNLTPFVEVNRTLNTWVYPQYDNPARRWSGTTGLGLSNTVGEIRTFSSRPGPIATLQDDPLQNIVVGFTSPFRTASGVSLAPVVQLTTSRGGRIASEGSDAVAPTIPGAMLNKTLGGLPPNFTSSVSGFTFSNVLGSEAFTISYTPVTQDQSNRLTATGVSGFMAVDWTASSTTQSQSIVINTQNAAITMSSPNSLSGINTTYFVNAPFQSSASASNKNILRIVNTTLAAGDTLATSVENSATTLVLYSNATPRIYDLQLARDTTLLTFPRISMGANEQHQIRASSWDNLRTSPIYLIISKRGAAAQGAQSQVLQLNPNANNLTDVRSGGGTSIGTMRVFPNPASTLVSVEASVGAASTLRLQLVNILGQVLWSREETVQAGAYRTEIDMTNFPAGVYIVRIATGEHYQTARIVKP